MNNRLWVSNLSSLTTEDALWDLFESDGREVTNVHISKNLMTGKPRGNAIVGTIRV